MFANTHISDYPPHCDIASVFSHGQCVRFCLQLVEIDVNLGFACLTHINQIG